MAVFWEDPLSSLAEIDRRFRGASFIINLPVDGDSKHSRNVSTFLPEYIAQRSRRRSFSYSLPPDPEILLYVKLMLNIAQDSVSGWLL
jgi:hypothetical protein